MKPEIKVYDRDGNDVTGEKDWYIGMDGHLYYSGDDGLGNDGIHIDIKHHYSITMKVTEGMIWQI